MAFNPNSTIYLCNVPIDSTYKNQIYFANAPQQYAYFAGKAVKRLDDYTTVREKLPDGGFQSKVRVGINIDDLYQCNYMMYQNANHGAKFFYAFIVKLIYINEGMTEIVFETDVYQTWLFDVQIKQSYVVREHSETDYIGDNRIEENLGAGDYVYEKLDFNSDITTWGYLAGASGDPYTAEADQSANGKRHSGIYQGLHFFYFDEITCNGENPSRHINNLIKNLNTRGYELEFLTVIPRFCIGLASVDDTGLLSETLSPAIRTLSLNVGASHRNFQGYKAVNNKLHTMPYYGLVITNHSGQTAEYDLSDFTYTNATGETVSFALKGDISASPSLVLYPYGYKGLSDPDDANIDFGLSIPEFPQCSNVSDAYKLWLARNHNSQTASNVFDIGSMVAGVGSLALTIGSAAATGGAAAIPAAIKSGTALASAAGIISGAKGVASTISAKKDAANQPNAVRTGNVKNSLLTAIGENKFEAFLVKIRKEQAISIDNYFTMYGYQTNRIKQPNVSKRPYYNYVQTADINIVGAIPSDDMTKLKAMYNNGVTLWKSNATVGDYTVNNKP